MIKNLKKDIERDYCKEPNLIIIFKYLMLNKSIQTITLYRLSNKLAINKLNLLSKILSNLNFWLSSCDISPHAVIKNGAYLPHPTGIVIGKKVIIGNQVTIYQNVTIGRKNLLSEEYPIIDDNVIISAGACVIGNIKIGNKCCIGANSVVIKDIEQLRTVAGIPAKYI